MATSVSESVVIEDIHKLQAFLSTIRTSDTLYLDFEGFNLSRHGTISVITILVHPSNEIRLIDVVMLGSQAFSTASKDGKTLRSVLKDQNVLKYIWDVRNDADALWSKYGVGIAGVIDIQLLENASRPDDRTYVHSLEKSVQNDLRLGFMNTNRWLRIKQDIQKLMSSDIFSVRPMDTQTIKYCQNDVMHLPGLLLTYTSRIKPEWLTKVKDESTRRAAEARSPECDPQSDRKKLGPWSSSSEKRTLTIDQMCELMEEEREEAIARDLFGYEDDWDDYDDDCMYRCDEEGPGDYEDWGALHSDWDRN